MDRPLNILTLSTLFPNAETPNFGIFVERQTAELSRRPEADVIVLNPIAMPPFPVNLMTPYRSLKTLKQQEDWHGLSVLRPRFPIIPKFGGAQNPRRIFKAVVDQVKTLHAARPFDLIDAEFFYPDGPAAMHLAQALNIPFTIKARGADIHHWGAQAGCREQVLAAADAAAGLLCVSAALRQDMIALGMDGSKITVHYTGLDTQKFNIAGRAAAKQKLAQKLGPEFIRKLERPDSPLFICTGALIPRKNQHLVIEALTEFPEATLLLAGTGPEKDNYTALAGNIGVSEQVHFLGSVPHDALPDYLKATDISILASKSEGLANAWVESLACGTPIIISEAGGARELVTSPDAGRIVEQSSAAIAEAIRSILQAPPSPERVADSAAAFSWQSNGDQLVAFFRNIAANGAA